MKTLLRWTLGVVGLVSGFGAQAETIVVTNLGDATADLVCDAQCTLREAIASAQDGDTIVWSPTLPFPATTLLVANAGGLTISKNLTIVGPGAHRLELNAQDLSRVMTIILPATAVTISGLTLSHGRERGADGAQDCYEIPDFGLVCTHGLPGAIATGGCVHASVAQLTISGVDIHDCSVIGGRGGHGGSYGNGMDGAALGGLGGHGGTVTGGAVYSTGALTLIDSAIHAVSATAGGGGNGGWGADSGPAIGVPGVAGSGGHVHGGVLYTLGGATLRNVTVINDLTVSGFGGNGGPHYNNNGEIDYYANGGHGGWIYGSAWVWQGVSKASFSTFHAGDYDVGARGIPGATADGNLYGRYIVANDGTSPLDLHKSVFTSSTPTDPIAPMSYCVGSAIATPGTIAEQTCSDAIVTPVTLSSKITGAQGITTLPPHYTTSVAINAASNCLDADGQTVTHDANGSARPQFGFCDLGAHEVTDAVFLNGFE